MHLPALHAPLQVSSVLPSVPSASHATTSSPAHTRSFGVQLGTAGGGGGGVLAAGAGSGARFAASSRLLHATSSSNPIASFIVRTCTNLPVKHKRASNSRLRLTWRGRNSIWRSRRACACANDSHARGTSLVGRSRDANPSC